MAKRMENWSYGRNNATLRIKTWLCKHINLTCFHQPVSYVFIFHLILFPKQQTLAMYSNKLLPSSTRCMYCMMVRSILFFLFSLISLFLPEALNFFIVSFSFFSFLFFFLILSSLFLSFPSLPFPFYLSFSFVSVFVSAFIAWGGRGWGGEIFRCTFSFLYATMPFVLVLVQS